MMEPAKAPWIRPGVVTHEPSMPVDDLLAEFALNIRARGFAVQGYVQRNNLGSEELGGGCASRIELLDLGSGDIVSVDRDLDAQDPTSMTMAASSLRAAMRDDADLVVISRFSAFEKAAKGLMAAVEESVQQGMPVLTSIAGRCLHKWHGFVGQGGAIITPDMKSLWQWWGADRLYQDLALGVPDEDVRRIVCGPRWLMIEGQSGAGLAYLPRGAKEFLLQLPKLRRLSLRQLADMVHSWEPLEMAVGIAAINAHYNRFDLDGLQGNGAQCFQEEKGRVVVIGAFPGLAATLPNAQVIETEPRPGEFPIIAMDSLVPGCAAAVVASSTLINRNLPRILRLAQGARTALVGPGTPLTPRLYDYGINILGGLVVRDPAGLAAAIQAGALPREFGRFGRYVHIRRDSAPTSARCLPQAAGACHHGMHRPSATNCAAMH